MMDLLAKRDHSRKELVKKLSAHHTPEEVQQAIRYAEENDWIPPEQELAEKFARELHKKKKGIQYINSKLVEKGLPRLTSDEQLELEKALSLIENKYDLSDLSEEVREGRLGREEFEKQKARMGRFLVSRGFDQNIVRKVLYDKIRYDKLRNS